MLCVVYGCAGDHDRLKKEEGGGGVGGVGGAGGDGGDAPGGEGGTMTIEEPPGPPQLTFVNGTVDEDAIRVCFVPYPAGAGSENPWPDGDRVPFARAEVIPIDEVIPGGTDVEVVLLAAPLASTDGRSCAELIDTPPLGVLPRSVGVLPQSVFATEKSILLVSAGCVGGRDHEAPEQEQICGPGYAPDLPNATLVAGFMSRLSDASKIPLQFVQASAGLAEVQLRVQPGNGGTAQAVVTEWTFGAIAPYPPYMGLGTDGLGSLGSSSIDLVTTGSSSPFSSIAWAQAFDNGTIAESDVQNGVGVTFIGVGPSAAIGAQDWWNGFTYTAVRSDP